MKGQHCNNLGHRCQYEDLDRLTRDMACWWALVNDELKLRASTNRVFLLVKVKWEVLSALSSLVKSNMLSARRVTKPLN